MDFNNDKRMDENISSVLIETDNEMMYIICAYRLPKPNGSSLTRTERVLCWGRVVVDIKNMRGIAFIE